MPEQNDKNQPKGFAEFIPPMSEADIKADLQAKGATQEQIDMDISHLDRSKLVDPKYLPAIAAQMMREGKMPNFRNPQVLSDFGRIVEKVTREVRAEEAQKRKKKR